MTAIALRHFFGQLRSEHLARKLTGRQIWKPHAESIFLPINRPTNQCHPEKEISVKSSCLALLLARAFAFPARAQNADTPGVVGNSNEKRGKDTADKSSVMDRQRSLLNRRYDFSDSMSVVFSGARKKIASASRQSACLIPSEDSSPLLHDGRLLTLDDMEAFFTSCWA